jgi:hypothetical protein
LQIKPNRSSIKPRASQAFQPPICIG